jgi:hypothetical protein
MTTESDGNTVAERLGTEVFDFDNDGVLDLFLANGHPDDMVDINMTKVTYKEPLLLFRQASRNF